MSDFLAKVVFWTLFFGISFFIAWLGQFVDFGFTEWVLQVSPYG